MTKLIRLLSVIVVLVAAQGMARSAESKCRFVEWGYGYIKVADRGKEWTYVLKASGPQWKTTRTGYHVPGFLSRQGGASSPGGAGGVYFFDAHSAVGSITAAARAERRTENLGYPRFVLGPDVLEHRASREAVRLGPLSGYAVFYRVAPEKQSGGNSSVLNEPGLSWNGLLVISLTDGCIAFETTLVTGESRDDDELAPLDSLLSEVVIKKSPSSEAERPVGGTHIVRPPRPGEEPYVHSR